jgi:hypothetical protein
MPVDRKGSGKERRLRRFPMCYAPRKTHVWNEKNGGNWRCIHQGLLVWIHSFWTQYPSLCSLLATVSHTKEHHNTKNRERDNGTDNTC